MKEIFGMEFLGESTNSSAFSDKQSKCTHPSHHRQDMIASADSDMAIDEYAITIKHKRASLQKLDKVQVRVVPIDTIHSSPTHIATASITHTHSFSFKRWQTGYLNRNILIFLLVIVSGILLTSAIAEPVLTTQVIHASIPHAEVKDETIITNGANRWDGDTEVTNATATFSSSRTIGVSSIFSPYYNRYNGIQNLGKAVTVAFPTSQGWMQFFQFAALMLPSPQRTKLPATQQIFTELINSGRLDSDTGVIRLPLIQSLLTVGSQAYVGGDSSSLTFADLRQATNPSLMQPMPTRTNDASPVNNHAIFIKDGTRAGHDIGHLIPAPFWNYITRSDIAPDGWGTDFGPPLTEALPFTITTNGVVHQMRVQLFLHDGVVLDESNPSQVQPLETGIAYLDTLGPPDVVVQPQQNAWAQVDTALFGAADASQPAAHVAANFPFTLLSDTSWKGGTLWYHVQWSVPQRTMNGWIEAQAISFTSPGSATISASIDILSAELAAYLTDIGSDVGVTIFDATRQRYYTYNENSQFAMASSMKVPILFTFLDMTEQQGREPNDQEMQLLTTMIENSNNDSASALFDEEGKASAVASYMQKIHIPDMSPNDSSWGYSLISPLSMVKLLTMLYQGKILTDQDRQLAFSLMENIESDQQVGVGDTAPDGATVAMKDGWVTGPDGLWVMNSSGIVSTSKETYIIAVYTQDQATLQDGQAISEYVCKTIASLLS